MGVHGTAPLLLFLLFTSVRNICSDHGPPTSRASPSPSPSLPPWPQTTNTSIGFLLETCDNIFPNASSQEDCSSYRRCIRMLLPNYDSIGTSHALLANASLSMSNKEIKSVVRSLKDLMKKGSFDDKIIVGFCVARMVILSEQFKEASDIVIDILARGNIIAGAAAKLVLSIVDIALNSAQGCNGKVQQNRGSMSEDIISAIEASVEDALFFTSFTSMIIKQGLAGVDACHRNSISHRELKHSTF